MPKITGSVGNTSMFRTQYNKMVAKGEGLIGTDFKMSIEGYEDVSEILVQAAQLPPMNREMIETYGPLGVRFLQAGNYNNAAEIPITFKEVIKGDVYRMIRDWIVNKRYLKVRLVMTPESLPSGVAPLTFTLHDCWLNLDGVDLSVEDRAAIVKPAGTLMANFIDPEV
ncbi:MAG: hypothetical protein IBX50_04230 [Marinospirillum sp.]|uniref:hypothetical protein n=1 Tax=Marinospirillum sp. TaxID=2183934 RepID=UPI0019E805E1|nr:hypothetical protein [Marinospirillum sp.]MBE0505914.1 hypothetical protein [Marinospirillum sp.]